ncbi:hypothetical protein Tco_0903956, partial [Tanacetum coccineum]
KALFQLLMAIVQAIWNHALVLQQVMDIYEKDKNEAKMDKTEHGMEKSVRSQKVKAKKSTPTKSKSKAKPKNEEILNGPTRTHLMGRISPLTY